MEEHEKAREHTGRAHGYKNQNESVKYNFKGGDEVKKRNLVSCLL